MAPDSFKADVLISAGSNQGNKLQNLQKAYNLLIDEGLEMLKTSSVYETSPWGFEHADSFYNVCFWVKVTFSPTSLLEILLRTEKQLGRDRTLTEGYEARTIDLDIILWDRLQITSHRLIIPHPRAHLRKFVLIPAVEIAPDWIHSSFGQPLEYMLNTCQDKSTTDQIGLLFP